MIRGISGWQALVLPLALGLGACAHVPEPGQRNVALPESFSHAPDNAQATSLAALLPGQDKAFLTLADAALAAGPSLAAAQARIEMARAGLRRADADFLPELGAGATVQRSRSNPDQIGTDLPAGIGFDRSRTSYGANLAASWEPDLFGRLSASRRAALARLDAADADAAAVRMALLGDIAGAVIDWRTLTNRQGALAQDMVAAEQLARLSGAREEAGLAPGFDRLRAESAAAASRSRLAGLESERAVLLGRLVTLTAQPADSVLAALDQDSLPYAPLAPPRAHPSQLLTARPDVVAAHARLRAADAELAAAAASRFPRLILSGTLGLLAFDPDRLFGDDSLVGALGAELAGPLLDFGRIGAEIERADAATKLAFADYRRVVFTALGDAEGGYALISAIDREVAAANEEAASAQRAADIADFRYRAGLADFLTVLEARRAADTSGDRAASAWGRSARARVLLWQALGGAEGIEAN